MKKILAFLLAMMLVLSLAACGGGNNTPAPSNNEDKTPSSSDQQEQTDSNDDEQPSNTSDDGDNNGQNETEPLSIDPALLIASCAASPPSSRNCSKRDRRKLRLPHTLRLERPLLALPPLLPPRFRHRMPRAPNPSSVGSAVRRIRPVPSSAEDAAQRCRRETIEKNPVVIPCPDSAPILDRLRRR